VVRSQMRYLLPLTMTRTFQSKPAWFTEGFNTLDLKEAKALLDELNA